MALQGSTNDRNIITMVGNLFKKKDDGKKEEQRTLFLNQELPQEFIDPKTNLPLKRYPRNKIRTTKYTPLSFIPKNLLFQFTNIANSYFLLIIILGAFQIFGVQSPGMQAVPLIVIVILTAIKDGFEDYRRGTSDLELNNSRIHILEGMPNPNVSADNVGPWRRFKKANTKILRMLLSFISGKSRKSKREEVVEQSLDLQRVSSLVSSINTTGLRASMSTHRSRPNAKLSPIHPNTITNPHLKPEMVCKFTNRFWKDISAGDIIRIRNNEEVPADAIILSSSDPEGVCYVETKNLDGETNLKHKSSLHCGQGLRHANDLERAQMIVETEPPNLNLYKFRGVVKYNSFESEDDMVGQPAMEPATYDNILLRGCTLRNTKWALCFVVATGDETKIMLNAGVTPTKKSRISKELNLSVIFNFCILFVLCFVSGLVNGLFYDKSDTSRVFFEYKPYAGWSSAANGVVAFFVALILYQTLVPISLYISIEIIKTVQAYFIYADVKMYYPKLDFPCTPKSWNISDDLGQIEYIFSDKTGTLTQNVMEFKKCTIAGKSYGLAYTEAQQGMDKRAGVDVIAEKDKMTKIIKEDRLNMMKLLSNIENDQLKESEVTFISSEYVDDLYGSDKFRKSANMNFMLALALCHTVITETAPDGRILFKAESPDEAALVAAARDIGIVFREKTRAGQVITLLDNEKPIEYTLLEIIPFNSTRKRMSVVLQDPNGNIVLYCKGADNVIYERLDPSSDQEMLSKTAIHLGEFAQEGLRTLCIAKKDIGSSYFQEWHSRYKDASNSIEEDRDEKLELIGEELERNLTLLGGTAIEDRLQDGVPDSISMLASAGIKLWVLTGDKVETAINIGFSCNLLSNDMELLVIKSGDENDLENESASMLVNKYLNEHFSMEGTEADLAAARKDHSPPSGNYAIIVDGASLTKIFEDHELKIKFLLLCKQCRSVLCCRVSPAQKALIVTMVKDNLKVMTLAIGDGANDVAMIQAANIGVGIAGEEGRQAVMSSDYAIGQFRFLVRLLLVHGRWSYKRLAEMVPCFFYKNVNFVMALFWFGIFNNFDGSYLYEYTYLMFFNLAYTSLPVIFLGILDQDVPDVVSLLVPELYRTGILGLEWSQFKFFYYMFDGAYQSVIAFIFPWLLLHKATFVNQHGLNVDHRFWFGVFCAHISVISCNLYVLLQQKRWDWLSGIIYAFSILIIYFWTGVWTSSTTSSEFYKAASQCYGTVAFWCVLFIGVTGSILPRFCYDVLNRLYYPRDIDIIRERVAMGDFDAYPKSYDPTDQEDVGIFRAQNTLTEKGGATGSSSSDIVTDEKNRDVETGNVPIGLGSVTTNNGGQGGGNAADGKLRSRKNTIKKMLRFGLDSNNGGVTKDSNPLEAVRANMIRRGEVSSRSSLHTIRTSHDLGISSPANLMNIHSRNSSLR